MTTPSVTVRREKAHQAGPTPIDLLPERRFVAGWVLLVVAFVLGAPEMLT